MTSILTSFAYVCLLLWASLVAHIAHSVLFGPVTLTHSVVLGAAVIMLVDWMEDRTNLSMARYFAEQFSGLTFALVVVLIMAPYVLEYVK